MVPALASAAGEQTNTVKPGGSAKAFCVPASNTSMPSSSNLSGTVVIELTASTMNITSAYFFLSAASSGSGLITPVLVSLWMNVSASNRPVASFLSTSAARIGEPQSTCSASASLPQRRDTSSHLSEKAPHMQLSTFFETRLRSAPSITPQAEEVLRKTNSLVESNCCNCGWILA